MTLKTDIYVYRREIRKEDLPFIVNEPSEYAGHFYEACFVTKSSPRLSPTPRLFFQGQKDGLATSLEETLSNEIKNSKGVEEFYIIRDIDPEKTLADNGPQGKAYRLSDLAYEALFNIISKAAAPRPVYKVEKI